MTESEFNELVEALVEQGDIDNALALCNRFIAENSCSSNGFRRRAGLYARNDDREMAIQDIDEAIRLTPDEASYYFFRGWWKLENGDNEGAEIDQSSAINIEQEHGIHLVGETAYFMRALARFRLEKFDEALSDCENVEDDFLIYLKPTGKATKADLVDDLLRNKR